MGARRLFSERLGHPSRRHRPIDRASMRSPSVHGEERVGDRPCTASAPHSQRWPVGPSDACADTMIAADGAVCSRSTRPAPRRVALVHLSPIIRWLVPAGLLCGVAIFLIARSGSDPIAGVPDYALGPIPTDAVHVSPDGSDAGAGTAADPWGTLGKAIAAAGPGDTVVLEPGTYGAAGKITRMSQAGSADAEIVFRGDPAGPMPRIVGNVRISASHQRLDHILFDGPTGQVKPASADNPTGEQVEVSIMGKASPVDGVTISGCEVRGSDWHAGIYVDAGDRIDLVGNYVHDNGDPSDPSQENQSHGIYWSRGSGLVAENVIEHNVARGVQLYPAADGVSVANNTIVDNGKAGVQVGGESSSISVVNNIVVDNGDLGIRSSSLTGTDDRAAGNLLWNNGGSPAADDPLATTDSIEEPPLFAGAGYALKPDSPAVDAAITIPPVGFEPVEEPESVGAGPDLGARESW